MVLATVDQDSDSEDDGNDLGGLFKFRGQGQKEKKGDNGVDCTRFPVKSMQEWDLEEVTC